MIYDNILETIGNTPIIKIQKLAPDGTDIYVKAEAFNPMSSVKDRLALGIILDAEKRGVLKPGADGNRGHFGQYRDCAGHGLRGAWLPLRFRNGGVILG